MQFDIAWLILYKKFKIKQLKFRQKNKKLKSKISNKKFKNLIKIPKKSKKQNKQKVKEENEKEI